MNATSRWKKQVELENRTCEALVLGLRKPIWDKYSIPDAYEIGEHLGYALRQLGGELVESFSWWDSVRWPTIKDLSKIKQRVAEGLFAITSSGKEEDTQLHVFLSSNPAIESSWAFMIGDLYRFKPGERKKAAARVKAYWQPDELRDFRNLHRYMRSYNQKDLKGGENEI